MFTHTITEEVGKQTGVQFAWSPDLTNIIYWQFMVTVGIGVMLITGKSDMLTQENMKLISAGEVWLFLAWRF